MGVFGILLDLFIFIEVDGMSILECGILVDDLLFFGVLLSSQSCLLRFPFRFFLFEELLLLEFQFMLVLLICKLLFFVDLELFEDPLFLRIGLPSPGVLCEPSRFEVGPSLNS